VKALRISYPLILVNFKTYYESQGKRAVALAKAAEKVGREYGVCISVAPQLVDIRAVVGSAEIPVFSQHLDPEVPGPHTGYISPESLKEAGASGTILNHSEHRLRTATLAETVRRCRSVGLLTCVCSKTARAGKVLSSLDPDMVAVEPPELIGSGISVSKAKPEVIRDSVRMIKGANPKIHILCGAGVTTGEDVATALKLGAEGILVASGVIKAADPESVLRDFAAQAIHI
jgi:triosephosphate isomerase